MESLLKKHIDEIKKLCNSFHVEKLYVFGSFSTETNTEKSDVDFLVQFHEDIPLLEFANNYFDFHQKLEDLLQKKVDLVTQKSVQNPYLLKSINNTRKKILTHSKRTKLYAVQWNENLK